MPGWIGDVLSMFPGVPIFFFLSGFLIWNSILRTPDFKTYLTKRVFRIYPELWICVAIELISIILSYDQKVGLTTYLAFGFTQGTLFQFWTPDALRGWGVGVPNGSLWTITVIVQFYIIIWLFKGPLKKMGFAYSAFALLALISIGFLCKLFLADSENLIAKLTENTCLPYLWIFYLGVLTRKYYSECIEWIKKWVWIILILAIVIRVFYYLDINCSYPLFKCVSAFFFMLGIAFKYPGLAIKTDISYGIYIYHMIFVNLAVQFGLVESYLSMAVVLIFTLAFAWASYEVIVKSSNRRKAKIIQSI